MAPKCLLPTFFFGFFSSVGLRVIHRVQKHSAVLFMILTTTVSTISSFVLLVFLRLTSLLTLTITVYILYKESIFFVVSLTISSS